MEGVEGMAIRLEAFIIEVAGRKNRMVPFFVRGEKSALLHWFALTI